MREVDVGNEGTEMKDEEVISKAFDKVWQLGLQYNI